jgi:hypothetical protein
MRVKRDYVLFSVMHLGDHRLWPNGQEIEGYTKRISLLGFPRFDDVNQVPFRQPIQNAGQCRSLRPRLYKAKAGVPRGSPRRAPRSAARALAQASLNAATLH